MCVESLWAALGCLWVLLRGVGFGFRFRAPVELIWAVLGSLWASSGMALALFGCFGAPSEPFGPFGGALGACGGLFWGGLRNCCFTIVKLYFCSEIIVLLQ